MALKVSPGDVLNRLLPKSDTDVIAPKGVIVKEDVTAGDVRAIAALAVKTGVLVARVVGSAQLGAIDLNALAELATEGGKLVQLLSAKFSFSELKKHLVGQKDVRQEVYSSMAEVGEACVEAEKGNISGAKSHFEQAARILERIFTTPETKPQGSNLGLETASPSAAADAQHFGSRATNDLFGGEVREQPKPHPRTTELVSVLNEVRTELDESRSTRHIDENQKKLIAQLGPQVLANLGLEGLVDFSKFSEILNTTTFRDQQHLNPGAFALQELNSAILYSQRWGDSNHETQVRGFLNSAANALQKFDEYEP